MNSMQKVRVEKVTVNMGVGQAGEEIKRAEEIMKKITDSKPVQTLCKIKQPTWNIREGLPIGVKATLRGEKGKKFLEKAFSAKDKQLKKTSFDEFGNFGFGVREYIELPGTKYDPKLGIKGFDVLVTLEKPGHRVKRRKKKGRIGKRQLVSKSEAEDFVGKEFGVKIV